jgi:hypothetical protein
MTSDEIKRVIVGRYDSDESLGKLIDQYGKVLLEEHYAVFREQLSVAIGQLDKILQSRVMKRLTK